MRIEVTLTESNGQTVTVEVDRTFSSVKHIEFWLETWQRSFEYDVLSYEIIGEQQWIR